MLNQMAGINESSVPVRRMRTIKSLAAHYRKFDPETAITEHFIRKQILAGNVDSVLAGSKRLIAIEDFDDFLCNGTHLEPKTKQGQIRRIDY